MTLPQQNVRGFDSIQIRIAGYVNRSWSATSGAANLAAQRQDWKFTT